MSGHALVYPVLAQILLTLIVGGLTGRARFAAGRRGEFTLNDIAVRNENYPEIIRKYGNNFTNQFETPVLFYALVGLALYVGAVSALTVVLAWLYVAFRVGHAAEHIGRNRVMLRFRWFVGGVASLMLLWITVLLRTAGVA